MRVDRDDVYKMIGEVNHQRQILEEVLLDLSYASHMGRLDPYSALLCSAEGNLYRACVQLKEAYRQWERIRQVWERTERDVFVEESPHLVRQSSSS